MNRLKEIKELKALAEELQLENREIIRKYKITELAGIYNGIGPDSFPEWLSEPRCRGLYPRHRVA